ncbi:Uncharacterised protein [Mycobacteroides abscessus subsp. abscessus]|nr:Uncharacterised protein [Mycobacteroides abscessus subsp. abscessus]
MPDVSAADLSAAGDQHDAKGAVGGQHVTDHRNITRFEDA